VRLADRINTKLLIRVILIGHGYARSSKDVTDHVVVSDVWVYHERNSRAAFSKFVARNDIPEYRVEASGSMNDIQIQPFCKVSFKQVVLGSRIMH